MQKAHNGFHVTRANAAINHAATSLCALVGDRLRFDRPPRPRSQLSRRRIAHAHTEAISPNGTPNPSCSTKRNALVGRQPLEHDHGREPGVLTCHHRHERIIAFEPRHHRLGQPLADVGFAPTRRRAQPIETQPAHHGGQPRARIDDVIALLSQRIPFQPGILNRVFGVGECARQPIRHRQQM
jgi:hypothetical protein